MPVPADTPVFVLCDGPGTRLREEAEQRPGTDECPQVNSQRSVLP